MLSRAAFSVEAFSVGSFLFDAAPTGGWANFPPTDEETRRQREAWGILPKAEEIIVAVAERQAQDIGLDEQQRLEELERELQLQGIEWQGRYLALLNERRQRLIDAEIGQRLRLAQDNDAAAVLLLMAAA